MEKKNLFYLAASFCLLIAITIAASQFKQKEDLKESSALKNYEQRFPASVSSKNKMLLSFNELRSLKPKDLEKYLNGVAKIIAKSGKKNPQLFFDSRVKVSNLWLYLENEAFASSGIFKDGCLIGYIPSTKESCDMGIAWDSFPITNAAVSSKFANLGNGGNSAVCPEYINSNGIEVREQLCSPAVYGFNFDKTNGDKASLICLKSTAADACLKQVATKGQGDRLKKSLDLLNEANPDYWDNLGKGIKEICKPKNGGTSNTRDENACSGLKQQLEVLTRNSRGALKQYKNAYALAQGKTDSLDSLSGAGKNKDKTVDKEKDLPDSSLCSDVEKSKDSANVRLSRKDIDMIRQETGASEDSMLLLEMAARVCKKPLADVINQYGTCSVSSRVVENSSVDLKKAEMYDEAARVFKLRTNIKVSIESSNKEWLAFSKKYKMTPLEALEESRAAKGSTFDSLASKIRNGDPLDVGDHVHRSQIRNHYGLEIEDIKGIFCHDDKDLKRYKIPIIKSLRNFNAFAKPCLTEMGMFVRTGKQVIPPSEDNQFSETVNQAFIRDGQKRNRASRAPIVAQTCKWKSYNKGNIIDYLTSGKKFNKRIYQISKNYNGESVCKRINYCSNVKIGNNARAIRIGNADRCVGGADAINKVSDFKFSSYSCRLTINKQQDGIRPNKLPSSNNVVK